MEKLDNYLNQFRKTGISMFSEKSKEIFDDIDKKTGISKIAKDTLATSNSVVSEIKKNTDNMYQGSVAQKTVNVVEKNVTDKINELQDTYGDIRETIKSYQSNSARELLENTREQLVLINACILQISTSEASEWSSRFGKVLTAKAAGLVATSVLFSLVGLVGTAGTGTAIWTLSGAAAANATLAWVGSLIGGGMAAGAVLTGGLAIAAGAIAYKSISSNPREYDKLSDNEKKLVVSCSAIISELDKQLNKENIVIDPFEAEFFLKTSLNEIGRTINQEADQILLNLDKKNSFVFKQHVLKDYPRIINDGYESFIKKSLLNSKYHVPYLIGGVFYALLSKTSVGESIEEQLVLEAIKRSTNLLDTTSTESDISNYLSNYSAEQLKGIANNVKGIYHELLFVHEFNDSHNDQYAILFGVTNNPGADIQIIHTQSNEVIREFQLKATSDINYVKDHFEKYPDIEVYATDEVASRFQQVLSSGVSNEEITERTNSIIEEVSHNTSEDRIEESVSIATLIAIGQASIDVLKGKKSFEEAGIDATSNVVITASSCAIASYFFG